MRQTIAYTRNIYCSPEGASPTTTTTANDILFLGATFRRPSSTHPHRHPLSKPVLMSIYRYCYYKPLSSFITHSAALVSRFRANNTQNSLQALGRYVFNFYISHSTAIPFTQQKVPDRGRFPSVNYLQSTDAPRSNQSDDDTTQVHRNRSMQSSSLPSSTCN